MMGKGGAYDILRDSLTNRLQPLAVNGSSNDSVNTDPSNLSNQDDKDAIIKLHDHKQEIVQLRKLLAEFSVKETRILSEKHVLERRISLMRQAFDHQQQELVAAASKAISYRQDIIEENVRLIYALERVQEERTTFVSTLMPLLAEFDLNPPAADAQSIVSNLRVLLTHLQERLILSESRLRESRFQIPPWESETGPSNFDKSHEQQSERALSNSSPDQNAYTEPLESVNNAVAGQKSNEIRVTPPYLPPILEEPSSLIADSDEEEDDEDEYERLPAIKGLQILGEAFPGKELQASGYSTNGTTHCLFEWVRHMENGSVNYIDGANQPSYIVTADDVETYLAVEVQPLDDEQRKGDPVICFANSDREISCDPEMRHHIERTLKAGQASYKLHLWTVSQDTWEPATLEIKTEGYSIRASRTNAIVAKEKFSSATVVNIQYENSVEFSITSFGGNESYLHTEATTTDVSSLRDTIVLTLRLFIKRAIERKKGKKKRVMFFTK